MITSKKALKIILDRAGLLGKEETNLFDSLGRTLAEKVYSDLNIPPFDKSSMDGFAVKQNDRSKVFKVIENIPAGKVPQKKVSQGECSRIMTGAMLPRGANMVVPLENTEEIAEGAVRIIKFPNKANVAKKGEDAKKGELVLPARTKIRPQDIAILATAGKTKVSVFRFPKVAVISTGSELVEPFEKPSPGQIRNSNSSMILAQLKRIGINGRYLGIAKDNFAVTKQMIEEGLKGSDILLLTGGVSVGDYDFVKDVLQQCGVKILFDKVAIKPGKPTTFGIKDNKYVFGLPGNPVSAFVVFELFVVPLIEKMTNAYPDNKFMTATLIEYYERKNADREAYLPVILFRGEVLLAKFHGSGHIHSLRVNAIMKIEKGIKKIKKGESVDVRPI